MRNLKRALSLTLASVMLLGMMVMGSSALSFNDADDISNVTAATVLEEKIPDFPGAHAHISGGHVHVGPDVTVQSLHEALAEPQDLRVGFPGGV